MCRRLKRVRALLEHLSRDEESGSASEAKRRCIDRLPPNDRAMLLSATSDCSATASSSAVLMPDLSRLLAALEDDVIVNELNVKVFIIRFYSIRSTHACLSGFFCFL